MKFFFPDSQDLVDPSFDFISEERAPDRLRNRDDLYAHEVFATPPYDGLLVSKAIVDGSGTGQGKYTVAQRHRLLRLGVRDFFRLNSTPSRRRIETMGDCGAFSYVAQERPPFSVGEVIDFYESCGFDYGISVDHVILGFLAEDGLLLASEDIAPRDWVTRQELTLELAAEFRRDCRTRRVRFQPVGVAQGWSSVSYAKSVLELQKMGYRRVALGGMVPLKTVEILSVLEEVDGVRRKDVELHLLGVTRIDQVDTFARFGVTSFDTTSPLRRAFKDDKDNYHTLERAYTALRIPQVEGNPQLQRKISSGVIEQRQARLLEQRCLAAVRGFDQGKTSLRMALRLLSEYEDLFRGEAGTHSVAYQQTLEAAPWKRCPCDVCREIGVEVILFRGAERNRRRGFHNVWLLNQRLHLKRGLTHRATRPSARKHIHR